MLFMLDSIPDPCPLVFKTPGIHTHDMAASKDEPALSDEALSRLCEQLGLKTTKKYRILVARLIKQVGTDPKKLAVALKRATILS